MSILINFNDPIVKEITGNDKISFSYDNSNNNISNNNISNNSISNNSISNNNISNNSISNNNISNNNNGASSSSNEKNKRKAPTKPAKSYEVGHEMVSENDSQDVIYIVCLRKDGVKYWKKKII
jgi:hypothetical protein